MSFSNRLAPWFVLWALVGAPAAAQDESAGQHAAPARSEERASASASRRLPPDAVTEHAVALPGRTLNFKATAGTIKLTDEKGAAELADIAYVAYQLDGADPSKRPVTFVFNGGPGAASVWLHLGALGPWRLPMPGASRGERLVHACPRSRKSSLPSSCSSRCIRSSDKVHHVTRSAWCYGSRAPISRSLPSHKS